MKLSMFLVLTVTMLLLIVGISAADLTPVGSLPIEIGTDISSEEPSAIKLTNFNAPAIINKIPPLKQGIVFNAVENKVEYLASLEVANWKGFGLDVGYVSEDALAIAFTYDLIKLKDLGVNVPILDLIEIKPLLYASAGRFEGSSFTNAETSWGVGATLISVRFW